MIIIQLAEEQFKFIQGIGKDLYNGNFAFIDDPKIKKHCENFMNS